METSLEEVPENNVMDIPWVEVTRENIMPFPKKPTKAVSLKPLSCVNMSSDWIIYLSTTEHCVKTLLFTPKNSIPEAKKELNKKLTMVTPLSCTDKKSIKLNNRLLNVTLKSMNESESSTMCHMLEGYR